MNQMNGILVFSALLSISAQAATSRTKLTCEYQEKTNQVRMEFVVANLEKGTGVKAVLTKECEKIQREGDDGPQCPVKFSIKKAGEKKWITPENPYDTLLSGSLNGGDSTELGLTREGDNLYKSANDSCVSSEFVIYKNSGYKSGYITAKNNCDGDDAFYSKLSCKVVRE